MNGIARHLSGPDAPARPVLAATSLREAGYGHGGILLTDGRVDSERMVAEPRCRPGLPGPASHAGLCPTPSGPQRPLSARISLSRGALEPLLSRRCPAPRNATATLGTLNLFYSPWGNILNWFS